MKSKYRAFLICNILIPIIVGAAIYYFISPEVDFVKHLDAFFGLSQHNILYNHDNALIKFIRNYMLDILWAYALVYSVFLIIGSKTAKLWGIFLITGLFAIIMETLQLTPYIHGTFDIFDIIAELVAEMIAVFIIKKYLNREESNEKR